MAPERPPHHSITPEPPADDSVTLLESNDPRGKYALICTMAVVGLFTFLILEKIKGRPLSAKTQTIAQFVGMAVLLCVFLLVTYQDIAWLTFMR